MLLSRPPQPPQTPVQYLSLQVSSLESRTNISHQFIAAHPSFLCEISAHHPFVASYLAPRHSDSTASFPHSSPVSPLRAISLFYSQPNFLSLQYVQLALSRRPPTFPPLAFASTPHLGLWTPLTARSSPPAHPPVITEFRSQPRSCNPRSPLSWPTRPLHSNRIVFSACCPASLNRNTKPAGRSLVLQQPSHSHTLSVLVFLSLSALRFPSLPLFLQVARTRSPPPSLSLGLNLSRTSR